MGNRQPVSRGQQRAYPVWLVYPSGVGANSTPTVQHLRDGKREPLPLTAHLWVQVYQQVSLVPTHDASIGSLLFTIPLNPSPRTALLLADRDTLSQQLHTLQLLATHVSVGY